MVKELATKYEPGEVEPAITQRWTQEDAFRAIPDERDDRYVIMMPLPNVTGALHMGHAMDNVMQDLLSRWHRMQGDNTLWLAGTDHAGAPLVAVVGEDGVETLPDPLEGADLTALAQAQAVERGAHLYNVRLACKECASF